MKTEWKGLLLGLGLGFGVQIAQHLMAKRGFYVVGLNQPGEPLLASVSFVYLAACGGLGLLIGYLTRQRREAREGARQASLELAERQRKLEELNKKP